MALEIKHLQTSEAKINLSPQKDYFAEWKMAELKVSKAEKEIRRLKRALWLARADRAMMTLDYFTLKCIWFKGYMKVEPPKCDVKMIAKWANVERKCRAKAEE